MAQDTTLKAQAAAEATPLEPFVAPGLQPGTMAGAGAVDPQYTPGTDEYLLRSNPQFKAVNRRVFDLFNATEQPMVPAAPGAPSYDPSTLGNRDFVQNIRGTLPEGSNSTEDAAWYAVNVMRPQAVHDSKHIFGILRPILEQKVKEAQQAGGSFYPSDLTEEDVIGLAKQAGVNPWLVSKLVAEEGEVAPRKASKTYTMGYLKPMLDSVDMESRWGEAIFNNPQQFLFGKTGQARRDAFLAMARWKDRHGTSFLGSVMEGLGTVIVEGGYATGGFIEGGIGTIVTSATLGNVLMENGRSVLSDNWLTKSKEEQDEANNTLQTAHELAKKYGPELAEAMNVEGMTESERAGHFTGVLERRFGEFADPNELEAFRRLSELKAEGAFRPQMSWERLANFGEGVLNAVPSMVKMVNASTDPNSVFFRVEDRIKKGHSAATGLLGPVIGSIGSALAAQHQVSIAGYEAFIKRSDTYKEMETADLDKSIDLWEQNYKQLRGDGESIVGFFYRKGAEVAEAVGAETLAGVYRESETAAKGIMQEERLIQAGALADPVMTIMGAMKLIGIGSKAAAAAKQLQTVSAGLREVSAEAVALRASANTTSTVFDTAVADLRVKLEAALPGAQFTDDDIIGLAIGDRKSKIGQSASAQRIRKDIGTTISKNKGLSKRVNDLTAQLDELPDDTAGIDKLRSRPVGGAVIKAAGATTSGVGTAANAVANFLDEEYASMKGGMVRRSAAKIARIALQQGGNYGNLGKGALAGAYLFQGDPLGMAAAGIAGVTIGQVLRPDVLRSFGVTMQQAGRIQKVVAQNISEGRRYGESSFLRGAMDLEKQAAALQKQVVGLPGKPLTAAEEAILAKANMLVDDATQLRRMHGNGLENALRNTGRVVWDDGFVAGLTGGVLASLNDSDAFGAGVGMGIGMSGILTAANRAARLTPSFGAPTYSRTVLGDVATIVNESKDPVQRGHILEFLAKAGDDSEAYVQRAGVIRDLYMSTRGRVKFVKDGEFEAATILTASPEAEAKIIIAEAQALHPNDTIKAKEYAIQRKAQLEIARKATNDVTRLNGDATLNKARAEDLKRQMIAVEDKIKEQQAVVDAERIDWKDTKTVDANRIKLDRLLQQKSELDANLKVAAEQQLLIDGDLSKAKGEAKVEAPMRPYETRALPDGSTVRSASNAFYIVDGPQGKNVYVNIDSVDNIGAISEGWHALLADSAVESLMPEMVQMMWGNQAKNTKMAVLPEVTTAILDAYAADMSPEQRTKFNNELAAGRKRYDESNGADTSGLVEPTREAMTWILSAMDLDKRVGYRPGLSTPPGATASAPGFDAIRKTLFGDRTFSDNTVKGLKNLLDPTWGLLARKNSEHIIGQLQQSGMRFVESGDGTLRGYFFNSNNEIIRSPVFDKFYDKVVTLTGGKGSLRARPLNLYDPLIPLDQRLEFVKRNGMDWVLNEKGTDILPPLEAAQKSDGFVRNIEDTLNGIPEAERGMEVYSDKDGRQIRTGIPSPAEIAAIAGDSRIPQSYKENILTVLRTLASGEAKNVLTAEYSNVFSMNVDSITEHRLRIGKDIPGKIETRNVIPLAFSMGEAPVYDAKGNKVKVVGPDGKKVDATQRVIRMHGFDVNAFTDSKNHAFQQGLFVTAKDGTRAYLRDPKGNQYTAEYINKLFGSDAEFMNKATLWMRRYYAHGPLDPNSPTPTQPNGAPREVNPVSAEVLDPINPENGAAQRDALRAIFGLEANKQKLAWVEENRTTNTARGMLTRGTNFPLADFRLDQFGPLKENGQSMFIDQIGISSGQFVMSIKGWGSAKPAIVNGVSGMNIKTVFEAGENKYLNGEDIAVSEVRTHPTLPDVKIFIGTEVNPIGRKGMKTIAYTIGDGRILTLNTSDLQFAVQQVRERIIAMEDAVYIDSILNEYRYNRDKPLEGARAAQIEQAGPITTDTKVKNGAEMIDLLQGVLASTREGRNVPPSLRKFLSETNIEAQIANGQSAFGILTDLRTKLKERQQGQKPAEWSRLHGIIGHLDDAIGGISEVSSKYRAAYEVPTRDLKTDTIRTVFDLGRPVNDVGGWSADGLIANELFRVSKEFASDQFKNNKEYLEAVVAKLDEEMFNAADLEGEPFRKEMNRLEPAKQKAERALEKLKKTSPELWEAAPATETAGGTGAVINNIDDIVANGAGKASVSIGGKEVAFDKFAVTIDGTDASVAYVELQDKTQTGKGIGKQAYIALGNQLAEKGITLSSSGALLAEGNKLWLSLVRDGYAVRKGNYYAFTPKEKAPAAAPGEPTTAQGRDVTPRAGEAPEAPYMTPEEIAATREFRVGPDGKITRITQEVKSEYDRWRQRYDGIVKKRQQEAKETATAAERERRIFFAEQNRRAQVEIDSEESFAAQTRKRAQQMADRDAKEAARLQQEADQAQARADALRLNFERGYGAARAAADIKRVETNKLIDVALSSNQPLVAPGLLLVDANRLTVQPFRMAVATDTVRTPSVTTRTGVLYLKNMVGFESQTQGHQQAFFNYLFADQIGKGKTIATEAFRGPMAAQQGINLLNSRLWVAEKSGARLLREYRNADKAAGKDIITYKVYGANGMLIKQSNDAQDAVEAIENLERRFINTLKGPTVPVTESNMGKYLNQLTTAYLTEPASARPKGGVNLKETEAMQIEGLERYLPAKAR